jgi:hypothetical protein
MVWYSCNVISLALILNSSKIGDLSLGLRHHKHIHNYTRTHYMYIYLYMYYVYIYVLYVLCVYIYISILQHLNSYSDKCYNIYIPQDLGKAASSLARFLEMHRRLYWRRPPWRGVSWHLASSPGGDVNYIHISMVNYGILIVWLIIVNNMVNYSNG